MSMYDTMIERDTNGNIRIPIDIKISDRQAEHLADVLFQMTKKVIGVKQLEVSFKENDRVGKGGVKAPKTNKKWTEEEEIYMLKNSKDGTQAIADSLGRSFMSVYMHKPKIQDEFDLWRDEHKVELVNLSRDEMVDKFFGVDEE